MPLHRFLPGHGPAIHSAPARVDRELEQHRRRCRRIIGILEQRPASAFEIARGLWRERILREQPLLVVWEVLGHLDLMRAVGIAEERVDADGRSRYSLAREGTATHEEHRIVHAR
jgi:hypothetical protein